MYKVPEMTSSKLMINESIVGEPIEHKLERVVTNGEGVEDGAPAIYTERKDGILPAYDIRADKWDIALDALGGMHGRNLEKRMTSIEERRKALDEAKEDGNKNKIETPKTEGGEPPVAQ